MKDKTELLGDLEDQRVFLLDWNENHAQVKQELQTGLSRGQGKIRLSDKSYLMLIGLALQKCVIP